MSQRAAGPSTLELRREYGRLFDQAAGLIESFRACDCGAERHGANVRDLNRMVNDMMPTRQRVGACHSLPPCDGTNPEGDLSDERLAAILARLEWKYSVLDEEVTASPCDCADRRNSREPRTPENISDEERERLRELYGTPTPPRNPQVPQAPQVPIDPRTLMTLPLEVRNMVWWIALRPSNGIVRIIPHRPLEPTQNVYNRIRMGGPIDHLERFSVQGQSVFIRRNRETWALLGERHGRGSDGTIDNDFNVLRTNHDVYWEAGGEFWRRAAVDRLMFSFGAENHNQNPAGFVEYDGILSAFTFFSTLVRDDPNNPASVEVNPDDPTGPTMIPESRRFTQNTHGIDYLRQIRRIHLDLTNTTLGALGANRQALVSERNMGRANTIQYLDNLLDMLYNNCTGLQHLSLAFVGWLPDISQQPWVEGPPPVAGVPPVAPPSSMHWFTRLARFGLRPLNRLRLRVTFYLPTGAIVANIAAHPAVLRAARFLCLLRRQMLTNGIVLGNQFWRVRRDFTDPRPFANVRVAIPRITVEVDDSWDPATQTHSHHDWDENDESQYDPP